LIQAFFINTRKGAAAINEKLTVSPFFMDLSGMKIGA